jgi:hypothetical protein
MVALGEWVYFAKRFELVTNSEAKNFEFVYGAKRTDNLLMKIGFLRILSAASIC